MECWSCGGSITGDDHASFCPWCGAKLEEAASSAPDARIGQLVGARFRILRLLGEGGMGRVYVAEQRMGATHRLVALKMVRPDISGDPRIVDRFLHECAIVGGLRHPNTVRVFDFGQTDAGEIYLAMELLEGRALTALLAEGAMPLARVERILAQICGSLQEAHSLGIVHRDLKPDNLIVTGEGEDFVKVLDFGIARQAGTDAEPSDRLTQRGAIMGTPEYMSPEQIEGKLVDARSDIYSLGLIAYELLAGRPPFEADNPVAWVTRHLRATPRPLSETPAGAALPAHVQEAVLSALAKNPEDRPPSAKAFYEEFTLGRSRHSLFALPSPSARSSGSLSPNVIADTQDTARDIEPFLARVPEAASADAGTSRRWRIAALVLGLAVVALGVGIVAVELAHHGDEVSPPPRKPKSRPVVVPSVTPATSAPASATTSPR